MNRAIDDLAGWLDKHYNMYGTEYEQQETANFERAIRQFTEVQVKLETLPRDQLPKDNDFPGAVIDLLNQVHVDESGQFIMQDLHNEAAEPRVLPNNYALSLATIGEIVIRLYGKKVSNHQPS